MHSSVFFDNWYVHSHFHDSRSTWIFWEFLGIYWESCCTDGVQGVYPGWLKGGGVNEGHASATLCQHLKRNAAVPTEWAREPSHMVSADKKGQLATAVQCNQLWSSPVSSCWPVARLEFETLSNTGTLMVQEKSALYADLILCLKKIVICIVLALFLLRAWLQSLGQTPRWDIAHVKMTSYWKT